MNKGDLLELVARKAHLTKKATNECVDVFLDEIARILAKGEKVTISGFGTFRVIRMKGKQVKIPNTDKLVEVKPRRIPKFTPGKTLKDKVGK